MTDLVAADVTITVQTPSTVAGKAWISGQGGGRQRKTLVKIAFGDGALTVPSGGVPLPTAATSYGLVRSLSHLTLLDSEDAQGTVWKYDFENKKLRGYIQGVVVGAAGAVTMDDFPIDTTSEGMATAISVSLTNSAGTGTKFFGRLVEITGKAPAATAIFAEASGW